MGRDERFRDHEWNEALKYANKGHDQLGDFDTKVFKDEPERAQLYLEKASKDSSLPWVTRTQ